ncbi:DUF4105 domain-containing protein [Glaciecola sp. MF2-115]|uniref:lipoprotein N-acyltransferase Lnb domain-containing protein n=1 Tax=Glaciecola sp. MF2-115 TaxID=3384827 RepID=UPI0039A27FBC
MIWHQIKGRLLSAFLLIILAFHSQSSESNTNFTKQFVRLLHASETSNGIFKTEFTNRKLFSSSTQYFRPSEEIEATLAYLAELSKQNLVEEYYCQFPATYEVLQAHVNTLPPTNFNKCPSIASKLDNLQNISIIFAAGYMGNPASYFGHMFIKLDQGQANLKSATFNIGATVPEGENPVAYMLKGLWGSYTTEYKETSYYKQAHSYSQLEGRDIYEYKLKLDPYTQKLLALHLLELESMHFTYYFTHRNCAYEILKFIQASSELPEMSFKPLFYPVHLIEYLNNNDMIADSSYLPSNKTKFSSQYYALSEEEKGQLQYTLSQLDDSKAPVREIAKTIDADLAEVLSVYAYAHLDEDTDKKFFDNIKKLRLSFPLRKKSSQSPFLEKNLLSRSPIMFGGEYLNLNGIHGVNLKFRPAHYNQTDKPDDVAQGGKLVFLQTELIVSPELRLRKLDLVDVYKSEIGKTGLYGDDEHEWAMHLGYESVYLDTERFASLFFAKGYIGDNMHISGSFWLQYGVEASIRNNVEDNGSFQVTPKVNIVGSLTSNIPIHISLGYEISRIAGQSNQVTYEISSHKRISKNFGIQMNISRDAFGHSGGLGINYYF